MLVSNTPTASFATPVQPAPEAPPAPTWAETFGAAFRLENDVVSALSQPVRRQTVRTDDFRAPPKFSIADKIKTNGAMINAYPGAFYDVADEAQYAARVAQIQKEEKDRALLAAGGWGGTLAAISAGVISPVNFIPLIGTGARGLKALGQGLASGAAAGAIQGGILDASQQTRGADDLMFDIGAGAIVGGILGPIAGRLDAGRLARIEKSLLDETLPGVETEKGASFLEETPEDVPAVPYEPPVGRFEQDPTEELNSFLRLTDYSANERPTAFLLDETPLPEYRKLHEVIDNSREGHEVVRWLAENESDTMLREMAARIYAKVKDMPISIYSTKKGKMYPSSMMEKFNNKLWNGGAYSLQGMGKNNAQVGQLYVRPVATSRTVLHEFIHPITYKAVATDPVFKGRVEALQKRLAEYRDERLALTKDYLANKDNLTSEQKADFARKSQEWKDAAWYYDYAISSPQELLTVALSDVQVQKVLREIEYVPGRSIWTEFVDTIRKLIGLGPHQWSAMDEVLTLADDMLRLSKQEQKVAEKVFTPPVTIAASAGAKSVKADGAGRLKGIGGTRFQTDMFSKAGGPITRSPVIQVINQKLFPRASQWMAQLSTGGLRLEGNAFGRVSAEGGTVQERAKGWYTGLARSIKAIDDSYHEYMYGENVPSMFAGTRAVLRGAMHLNGKMDKFSFKGEISRAMREGDDFDGPPQAKAAAEAIRKFIYDPITDAAIDVGLISKQEVENIVGDVTYLNRVYNTERIMANRGKFVDILANNYRKTVDSMFNRAYQAFLKKNERDMEKIADYGMTAEEAKAAREELDARLTKLLERPEQAIEDKLGEMRAERQQLKEKLKKSPLVIKLNEDGTTTQIGRADLSKMREKEAALIAEGGDKFKAFREEKANIRRRIANINKAAGKIEEQYQRKLDKIAATEDNQLSTLRRMITRANKVDKKLAKILPGPEQEALLKKTKNQFFKQLELLDDLETTIGTIEDVAVARRYERLWTLSRKIEKIETMPELQATLKELREEIIAKTNEINSKRAVRIQKMQAAAKKLEPETVVKRIAGLKEGMKTRKMDLYERLRSQGYENIDLDNGTAESVDLALKMAREVTDKIVGTFNRLPGMEILQGERGPELLRVLNISSKEIEEFLENDVELLMRNYVRTMGSDIEMMRKFGTVDMHNEFRQLVDDFEALQREAKTDKEKQKIAREYEMVKKNLEAVVSRLRHTWGIPDNPHGAATRLARVAQNLNTMRFMGSVLISSIPDMAQPVLKYGLTRTFRDGFLPLIRNFKEFRMSSKEAFLAGTALDVMLHSRAHAMYDILDNFGRTSKAERALEFATSRIGMVALFDYWTAGMKQFAAVTANAELLEAIQTGVTGKSGLRSLSKAQELLASAGIDGQRAADIWNLVSNTSGGGKSSAGVWLPNTEDWLKPEVYKAAGIGPDRAKEALATYRAALSGEVDRIIITPGVERPLWMDGKSLTLRLIAQFRSFAFSSTQKTVMAGLQQADMAVAQGAVMSLALGAASYYIWAVATGGEAYEEMMSAGPDKWADEAIARSGLIGILGEVQRIGESIPLTKDYVTFSGTQSTRRGGGSLLEATAGPTFDLAQRMARVVTDADSPTQGTAHAIRTMLPLQNVFFLRQIFDVIEEQTGEVLELPEKRQ